MLCAAKKANAPNTMTEIYKIKSYHICNYGKCRRFTYSKYIYCTNSKRDISTTALTAILYVNIDQPVALGHLPPFFLEKNRY